MMAISSIFSGQKNRKMCTQRKEGKRNSQQRKSIPGRKKNPREEGTLTGNRNVLQVGLARHKQSHCAHSTQMMCEISIVKLTMEIDRSVSISGYSASGAARTVIKLEVYWFVLTHLPGKNFPNEKVREKKRRDWDLDWEEPHRLIVCIARFISSFCAPSYRWVWPRSYPLLICCCSIKIICNYIRSQSADFSCHGTFIYIFIFSLLSVIKCATLRAQ